MSRVFITGTAGFIGFHLARALLTRGFTVAGYDSISDYYDITLKQKRTAILEQYENFSWSKASLEDEQTLEGAVEKFSPDFFVHLAAQAGVRYSLENPRAYIDSNIIGTFNVLEVVRRVGIKHLLMASTSSVYGANTCMPFTEQQKCETPLTLYAATKKSNENMAHSYSHLFSIPITMFRFFTVYGPWGRPDLALFKFVDAMEQQRPIDIYNNGEMYRDFTYVDDLVESIHLLLDCTPKAGVACGASDTISDVAPFRVVNIGNSQKVGLLEFIEQLEMVIGIKAKRNYMGMQQGDVPATWASAKLLEDLTGFRPSTSVKEGIEKFVTWYRSYMEAS